MSATSPACREPDAGTHSCTDPAHPALPAPATSGSTVTDPAAGPTGRVVLLNGAATELGRALAARLVREGHTVVCADPDHLGGTRMVHTLPAGPGTAVFTPSDPECEDGMTALLRQSTQRHGRVDAVINTFWAAPAPAMLHELDADFLDRTLAITLREFQVALRCQAAHFLAQGGGVILNTTSAEAHDGAGRGHGALVDITLGMIDQMSRHAAMDHAPGNVRLRSYTSSSPDHQRAAEHLARTLAEELDTVDSVRAAS